MERKLIFSTILTFFYTILTSQTIKVAEAMESIGEGNHNAFVTTLYGVTNEEALEDFRQFMKVYDGKRTITNGQVYVMGADIKQISEAPVDVYAKPVGEAGSREIKFVVGFNLGGAFLNCKDYTDKCMQAKKIIADFAVLEARSAVTKELKDAKKHLAGLQNAVKDMEKENKNLMEDIEKYKAKIAKAEEGMKQIANEQKVKAKEIGEQQKYVEATDMKLKTILLSPELATPRSN